MTNEVDSAAEMLCTRTRKAIFSSVVFVTLTFAWVQPVSAQPKAIGPNDISRLQQQTEFSGDWSETKAFDLDRYVTLKVTIERLKIPDRAGNVYLWFTLKNQHKITDDQDLPAQQPFKATLQSVDIVKSMQIDERDFPRGVEAVIRGWPATEKNITGSDPVNNSV